MRSAWLLAAFLLLACQGLDAAANDNPVSQPQAAPSDAAMSEYRAKLEDYTRAHQKYEEVANAYWNSIAAKRRARNEKRAKHQDIVLNDYVLTQPPVYSGPPSPPVLCRRRLHLANTFRWWRISERPPTNSVSNRKRRAGG